MFSGRASWALSVKQPWAALLVHGRKSIEVRSWRTLYRGPVLIHAARVPDYRPQAWAQVPDDLYVAAQRTGGIIGMGLLTHCLAYGSVQEFARDEARHRNPASWFRQPALYGFVFAEVRPLPFRPYPGSVRFFAVEEERARSWNRSVRSRSLAVQPRGLFDQWR
jgi:ASCH domain